MDNKAKRDLQKETARSSDFNGELDIDHILPSIPGFTMEAESSNALKSKADFKDERSFVDRVTVVVLDVLPNGNLVVTGTRDRNIAGDIQTIEVSGIVRPSDIAYRQHGQEPAGRQLPHRDEEQRHLRALHAAGLAGADLRRSLAVVTGRWPFWDGVDEDGILE